MRSIVLLVTLAACGQGLRDDRFATGSSTIASSRSHDVTYAVNVDEGSVSRVQDGKVTRVQVGREPSRVARVGDEMWVTLRGERGVAVVTDDNGELDVDQVLTAGAEPVGIVASENGKFVYVANSMSDTVVEYDGKSREILREFAVQDHPTWLALHPSGRALFVGSQINGTMSRIDLKDGDVTTIDLPKGQRNDDRGQPVALDPRISGDPSVSPNGGELAIPTVYADTSTSVDEPETPEEPIQDGYGSAGSGIGVSRINPVLVVVDLGPDGDVEGDPEAVFLAAQPIPSFESGEEQVGTVSTASDVDFGGEVDVFSQVVRSYPTSVTASPSSNEWLVTMEASNAVVVVSAEDRRRDEGKDEPVFMEGTDCSGDCRGSFTSPEQAGFAVWNAVVVSTAAGPKGVAFDDQEHAVVHSWLAREVEGIDYGRVDAMLEDLARGEFSGTTIEAAGAVRLADSALPADIEEGRRMFFSATDSRMAANGAGVSCSTCHMEGRNDGFTWTLRGEPRNTPSLAGPVEQTAPVTWSEEVGSVAEEAQLTSRIRMGGQGLSVRDASLIETYVNSTAYPDVPRLAGSALVEQGREVFEREDVGCASCHMGDLYTDTELHFVRGEFSTQTPTLRGVAASGPYYHDGSAPTLEAVVATAKANNMGDTSMLSAQERSALVAFLESL